MSAAQPPFVEFARGHGVRAVFALASALSAAPALADIALTATAQQASYARGRTNTFDIDVLLFSQVFENADDIHFRVPPGTSISAVRFVDGFTSCPDAPLLALGLGSADAGWFNAGHPSGCGFFFGFPEGALQRLSIDVDVPPGFAGDLRVDVVVEGDGCCDPPPHDALATMTFADAGSPAHWNFDDVPAPALPAAWSATTANAGVGWNGTADAAAPSAPNVAHAPAAPRRGEASLVSPRVLVDATGGELRFRQRFALDAARDGGVLEIAIDGGAFADIVGAGGSFRSGGYGGAIGAGTGCSGGNVNPLVGRDAFTGASNGYEEIAVALPAAAAGHDVQLRWRLGSDCNGDAATDGWSIDDVALLALAPSAQVGADPFAFALDTGAQHRESIGIGNAGGGVLDFTIASAPLDCAAPAAVPWLHLSSGGGSVPGGTRAGVDVQVDSTGLGAGENTALLCVATNDSQRPVIAVPVTLVVTPDACRIGDRVFRDGFDGREPPPEPDLCDGALRTYSDRAAFLADVAPGFSEDHYTGLRSGSLSGPIEFSNGTFAYSVFTQPDPLNPNLFLYPGAGVLSTRSAADRLTLTFTGAPVTAIGGDFSGALFVLDFRPPVAAARIVLTLEDGRSETFIARRGETFRGLISDRPIRSLSIAAPDVDEVFGDLPFGVLDNFVVGRAR